jgi:hypothetical protein
LIDNCISIARENFTPNNMSELINDIYKSKKLNNMAVILNGTDEKSGYGYGYRYAYGYGYGKNNSNDKTSKSSFFNRFWNK